MNSGRRRKTLFLQALKISKKVQRQNHCKIAKVSLKSFSSKKYVIEFYIHYIKDLKPNAEMRVVKKGIRIMNQGNKILKLTFHLKNIAYSIFTTLAFHVSREKKAKNMGNQASRNTLYHPLKLRHVYIGPGKLNNFHYKQRYQSI